MTDLRTDDDLERLLRSTLTTAAETVTSGPTRSAEHAEELLPARPHRRWLAPVAAAAAAAVVAGIIVASRQPHDDDAPATTTTPSVTVTAPTPTPTPHRGAVDVTRAACSVPLPAAWAASISKGTSAAGSDSVLPLAMFPDGRVVVTRDLGTTRDVALLDADGHSVSMYTVPKYSERVTAAQVEGNTILIQVSKLVQQQGRTVFTIANLVVVDPGLGTVPIADVAHEPGTIDGAAMLDGHVYYDRRPNPASQHGTIYGADLMTYLRRAPNAVYTGDVAAPKLFGGGIGWSPTSYRIDVPRSVPAPVAKETRTQPTNRDPAVTDGTSWAWADNSGGIAWYRAGRPGPVHLRLGKQVSVYAVTGNYVLYQTGDLVPRLIDVRTGATVALPGVAPTLTAGSGVVAVAVSTGAAKDSPTKVLRLDTAELPGLTC